jgi:hypothetical protein
MGGLPRRQIATSRVLGFRFTIHDGRMVTISSTFGSGDQPYDDEQVPLPYDHITQNEQRPARFGCG